MEMKETILAYGHKNVLATHKTTLEITKEANLSKRGNCVIAVSADRALRDLSSEFRESLRRESAELVILIEAGEVAEKVVASGSSRLMLDHPGDMVVRKSGYICNRTLAIQADKAACDLARRLVERLRDPAQNVKITLLSI